jgi:hypothetical protein
MHRYWDPFSFFQIEGRRELTGLHFWGCNLSFHREFLLRHGLFRDRRGAGNEDTELGYRLSLQGLKIYYEPDALGYHHHEVTIESACARARQEGRNFDMLDPIPRHILLPFIGIYTLEAGLGTALRMLPKEIFRATLFHPQVTDYFWIPVLNWAERLLPARLFAYRSAYRGVFGCYYRRGMSELQKNRRTGGQSEWRP